VPEVPSRVARWYILKPKILICVNIGGHWNEKGWYIPWTFATYYLCPFGLFLAIW
jgi:hypothetical protein